MLRPSLKNYFRRQGYRIRKRDPHKENSLEIEIAETVGLLRFSRDWTQAELAQEIGTTQSVIARLESGWHTPSLALLKRIAKAFDLGVRVQFYEVAQSTHLEEVFRFEEDDEANKFNLPPQS
ncbi:MAG: Helix-turn-helix domain protein [Candidatus Pacebacteria bacterium GW2011_GWA1_46_10]|nr:MAG: Helix-turn-helix domain protein [Candidatus Pacebacteria bacterium GW2011_GWA1_46_10]HCR81610.1 hypothetical protein [Candidatus Paceibacterota bacterium]